MATFQNLTLRERTYHALLDLVLSGSLPLGSQLDEQQLADQLSISRTPIREAINMLVKDELVEYRSYKGNFVRTFTEKDVQEVYQVRAVLEGLAARLAVQHLTEESLTELEAILIEIAEAVSMKDLEVMSEADRRFHKTIVQLSQNRTLEQSLGRLDRQVRLMRFLANHDPNIVVRTSLERPQIMEALKARDGERAGQLLEEHIKGVKDSLIKQLTSDKRSLEPKPN